MAEIGLALGGGELAAAERASGALIEKAPFSESGYRLRMQVLAERGNVAQALQAYERLRELLRDELGVAPSAELVALHDRLLRGGERRRPARAASSGLFGRERELRLLEDALTAAGSGSPRVLLVAGEPGIGKTRLARELSVQAECENWDAVWGRCAEGEVAPAFWPWVELIRALAERRQPAELDAALERARGELSQILPELGAAPALTADPAAARYRLYDAVRGLLLRLAAQRPLLLVLDDLQWADAPSLELLRFCVARLGSAPLAIVGTYREGESGPLLAEALAELAREPAVSRLRLEGLGPDDVSRVIAQGGEVEPAEEIVAAVHSRTAGNPFFVTELARLLASEGAEAILRGDVPGGVREVILRRLGRLPAGGPELLTLAAVVGERFELEVPAAAAELDDDRALELLEAALRERVVAEDEDAAGAYRFSHALVRETLYSELSAGRRAREHRRVAAALRELHGDDPERLTELAHHLYEGASAGTAAEACDAVAGAADQALGRLAYEQAEEQLRRGVELARRMQAGSGASGGGARLPGAPQRAADDDPRLLGRGGRRDLRARLRALPGERRRAPAARLDVAARRLPRGEGGVRSLERHR